MAEEAATSWSGGHSSTTTSLEMIVAVWLDRPLWTSVKLQVQEKRISAWKRGPRKPAAPEHFDEEPVEAQGRLPFLGPNPDDLTQQSRCNLQMFPPQLGVADGRRVEDEDLGSRERDRKSVV